MYAPPPPTHQEASTGQPLPPAATAATPPRVAHVYWHPSSAQWVLHLDLDPALNYDHYLGYAKVRGRGRLQESER